jgi:hypothetical protein
MNIEELSKSQLVLLTILVNFVVSIATGILTVSLLDQAPPVVTQTINRVVDHTIERVVEAAPVAITKPSSPAPSNQDLVMAALAADVARAVRIYSPKAGTTTPALAVGSYLPDARAIVTASVTVLPKEVVVRFADDSRAPASLSHVGSGIMIYGFSDTAVLPKVGKPLLVSANDLKLGQTVLAVGTDGGAATGIVSRVSPAGVHTTLPDIGVGSAAVDLAGNLIGIASSLTMPGTLVSAGTITALLTSTSTPR